MPIFKLTLGPIIPLIQNQIYALPEARCLLFTDATTPTLQQSSDSAFATNAALTLTNGQAEVAGAFLRCTSGNINVTLAAF